MSQRYNDNTKKPKLNETQPGILKIYICCWKIQQKGLSAGESAAGITYSSIRIHPKSCCNFT